jgi:two-component system, NtrC family, response regulator AtoC
VPSPDEHDELALNAVTQVGQDEIGDEPVLDQLQMVVIGNGTFATHPLSDGAVTIGRSRSSDVAIADESISRRHAILRLREKVTIEDLGSANGTRVRGNELKVGRPVEIVVGELVGLGKISFILQHRSRPSRARRLWTHDYFEARLDEECARTKRSNTAFALLRIQTDRNAPTTLVEETLAELVRDTDILGKSGPHDYEVLLPDTTPTKSDEAVRRFDSKLVERGLKYKIVVACCPRDGRRSHELMARVQTPSSSPATPSAAGIVVVDAQMQSLHRLVEQIADSQIGVLLLGETGVGKEVFARAVHHASPRAAGPFVELNCAALTESLLESELFGHEKGSFTNATIAKPGLIETAHGGTLFLDEIGDMPLSIQAKLLRILEDSQLRRVGALKNRAVDVRFVAATNSDLEARIADGAFRSDLFFRLNGVTIVIPPLRDRMADLEPLAKAFIHRAWSRNSQAPTLDADALALMKGYCWPGNVRELKNMMERAILLCGVGPIRQDHLPAEKMRATVMTGRPRSEPTKQIENVVFVQARRRGSEDEQRWITQALEQAGGNQTRAAVLLGISRRTLVNRLNDYNHVDRPRKAKKRQD